MSSFLTGALLIVIGVLLFGFIIFIHEFGHFFTAKLSGIRVNEFAIGMGPTIFSFHRGETDYTLRLLPIGGFCAMEGEDEDSSAEGSFNSKPVWKRILVVIMGAVMNILFGLFLSAMLLLPQERFLTTEIQSFPESSPVQAVGLQEGDRFTRIDNFHIFTMQDISFALSMANAENVYIEVDRNGEKLTFSNVSLIPKEEGGRVMLGVNIGSVEKTPVTLLTESVKKTVSIVQTVWVGLAGILSGRFGLKDMAGPIGMTAMVGQVAEIGLQQSIFDAIYNVVSFMMMITVNLGVMNLLPLPALDGGRLIFLLIEAVRRKPIDRKYEAWINTAGFVLLMCLMVVITFSDLFRIFSGKGFGT